jgi:hypothetical protein
MKIGENRQDRYELQCAVLLKSHQQLDEKINDLLKDNGYQFLYSSEAKPIIQHLEEAKFYDQAAIELSQQVSKEQPIVFKEIKRIIDESTLVVKDYLSICEYDTPALPELDSRLAFWEKPWISDELKSLLFSQPDHLPSDTFLNTYLILDAVTYTHIRGIFDLDLIDSPSIKCLYKGEAAQTMEKVAPYIVDMTLPNVQYDSLREEVCDIPSFHKNYFQKYWGNGAGVFIRSTASFEKTHKHFRKFTRSLDETTNTWGFFHFYYPSVAVDYFHSINDWAERCKLFFLARNNSIHCRLFVEQDNGNTCVSIEPNQLLTSFSGPVPTFTLTARDKKGLQKREMQKRCKKIAYKLQQLFPAQLDNKEDLTERVIDSVTRMQSYGFISGEYLFQLAAFEMFYGDEYETDEALYSICTSDLAESDKFNAFLHSITQLTVNRETNE